ncbi:hypothetical protein AgCh_005399 [Apium graveolens]
MEQERGFKKEGEGKRNMVNVNFNIHVFKKLKLPGNMKIELSMDEVMDMFLLAFLKENLVESTCFILQQILDFRRS